jgi:hypothetical protein
MFAHGHVKGKKLNVSKFLPHMTLVGSAKGLMCECTDDFWFMCQNLSECSLRDMGHEANTMYMRGLRVQNCIAEVAETLEHENLEKNYYAWTPFVPLAFESELRYCFNSSA